MLVSTNVSTEKSKTKTLKLAVNFFKFLVFLSIIMPQKLP